MKRFLLLLGAIPLLILVGALAKQRDFYGDGYPGWEAVEELVDKYELKMPLFTSRCSVARKIYYKAAAKNSYEEIKADPLFGRVIVYAYWNCYGHKDWPPVSF